MVLPSDALRAQFTRAGRTMRVRYYNQVLGSVWDDEKTLTLSGTEIYCSGTVHEVGGVNSSEERVLLEQGMIAYGDSIFFLAGSINMSIGSQLFTVAISGLNDVYRLITPGGHVPSYGSDDVFKKGYFRLVQGGSLI